MNISIDIYLKHIQEGFFTNRDCKKQCKNFKDKIDFQICMKMCLIKNKQERLKYEIFDIERRVKALDCTPNGVKKMRDQGYPDSWTIVACNKERNELINHKKKIITKFKEEINKLKNEIVELKKRKKG